MRPVTRRPSYSRVVAWAAVPFAVLAATTHPARAQAAAYTDGPRVAVRAAAAITRPVATYRLNAPGLAGFPAVVTVADSAGVIIASYRVDGDRSARLLVVTVFYTDLVLQADTPSGLLTLVLDGQNSAPTAAVTGRLWLGEEQ